MDKFLILMCYDIKASLEAQLNRARRKGDVQAQHEIIEKLVPLTDLPLHHVSGFSHPSLLIYTNRSPDFPEVATWGLVPHWVKDDAQLKKLWNSTLNARGETIFEKPSFKLAAEQQRCIVYVDGFYEHHHFKGATYPFFISHKNKEPLALAGLFSEYVHPETDGVLNTFTIVTTAGNSLLTKIHNNPKIKEPRMPLMLTREAEAHWLTDEADGIIAQKINALMQSYPSEKLVSHTVQKLRGKAYAGNVPEISEPHLYPELEF
ncbi:SOS response-associated peptidase [Patiriisocius sp. Uisw_047]|jgi:putative SOS response-associated peptidase YedK|uniref:SOS response-associated peptidase n=1 Tax=Patiriisocius sp. Uisw_047 TaxID=3230969 RepID=UPI0039ED5CDF